MGKRCSLRMEKVLWNSGGFRRYGSSFDRGSRRRDCCCWQKSTAAGMNDVAPAVASAVAILVVGGEEVDETNDGVVKERDKSRRSRTRM